MTWRSCKLIDVLKLQRGHDLPADVRRDGDVPVVSSSGITGRHDEPKAKAPGVVTGRYGTIGEVFYVDVDYWPLNTALYIVDFKGNDPRFAAYFLRNALRDYKSDKAAVPGVDRNVLHELPVRVPDLVVQRQIVEVLRAYDDLIENNTRRMALLEQSARLLYEEWFVRLRFPGREHTRVIDGVPDGWKRMDLEAVCVPDNGIQTGPFGSQLHQSDYADEGIPVVMPKDIVESRISTDSIARVPDVIRDRLARHVLQEGDIVLARRGDIGRKAFVGEREAGWMCGTGCMRVRPNSEVILPRLLFDTIGRPDVMGIIAGRAQGAIMPNLNLTIMADVPVVVPPMRLQRDFIQCTEPVHQMIGVLAQQASQLRQARDLLLPRLMSGEVTV